jgi:hypothetical protein
MSETNEEKWPAGRGVRPGCLLALLLGPVLFLTLMGGIGFGVLGLFITLVFGWITFLVDTWPRISWDWGTICFYILCVGWLVFLAHNFITWLIRNIVSASGNSLSWPLKWTCCGVIAIGLCMAIGMAVAGIAHQLVWLLESNEPMYELQPKNLQVLRDKNGLSLAIRQVLIDAHTLADFKKYLADEVERSKGQGFSLEQALQSSHVLLLANDGKVEGVLIFPRNPEAQRFGGDYIHGENYDNLKSKEVKEFIQKHRANLVAL